MVRKNPDTARFQEILDKLVAKKMIKQAIMAVESSDRSFRWSAAAAEPGSADTTISVDTPFFLASIDKMYNAAVVMLLHEQGRLELNGPVSDYLPADLTRGLHVFKGTDYSRKLTIRHLLSHTSGLADWLEDYPPGGRSLVEQILERGDGALCFEDIAERVRTELKPHFPPQDASSGRVKMRYSDTNYILIIALIEAICAKPLHEVHEELLYKPLSLQHTFFPGFSGPPDPTPPPVALRAGGRVIEIPELMKSFRGMYATACDAIAFMRKLTRNEVFRSQDTFALMQAGWNRFGFPLDRAALRSPGWPIQYGLGLMRFELPAVFTGMKRLPAVIGHTGSTGCWLFWCPETDLFFCGSVDETGAGAIPYRIMPELLKATFR